MAVARNGATAAGAAQLEVFLTGTARRSTLQCFGESDLALYRDYRLYNGPTALWSCPVAAARYCATDAGAAQLEVFLTGTARMCSASVSLTHGPARDRNSRLYNGPQALWSCRVAAARYCATAAGDAQLEVFLSVTLMGPAHAPVQQCFSESYQALGRASDRRLYNGPAAQRPCPRHGYLYLSISRYGYLNIYIQKLIS